MERILNNVEDYLNFFTQLSFSDSYCLRANGLQQDYQEYQKLNEQHLYNVTDFLKNSELQNKSIVLTFNNPNKNKIKYVVK